MLALSLGLQSRPVTLSTSSTGAQPGKTATHQDGEDHGPPNDPPDGCIGVDVPAPMGGQPGLIRSGELRGRGRTKSRKRSSDEGPMPVAPSSGAGGPALLERTLS